MDKVKGNSKDIFHDSFDDCDTESKIGMLWELLTGLSDDINEIKKKMGLDISIRTDEQRREDRIDYITKLIEDGKTREEIIEAIEYPGFKDEQDKENWKAFIEERYKLVHDNQQKSSRENREDE